jgi:hypothetical protein
METAAVDPAMAAEGAPRGTVYGFEVRSPEPLRYLREGSGRSAPTLRVVARDDGARPTGEPLRRWLPRPGNPFRADLFADGSAYRLRIEGLGWYRIDPEGREVWLPPTADPLRREERLYGIPLAVILARGGALPIHAATVQVGEGAVALAAPGRHGKTTLATALVAAGHRLLAEDVSCCTLEEGPAVLPGPALLRIRPDTFERLPLPGGEVTMADHDRVHLALRREVRGDCAPVPLRAIVFLHPTDGPPRLDRKEPHVAVQDLWVLATKLPTDEDRARCFEAIVRLADRVPAFDLARPNRWELLPRLVDRIVEVMEP